MDDATINTVTQTYLDGLGNVDHVGGAFRVACLSAVVARLTHTMLLDARTNRSMSLRATDLVAEIECEPLVHVRHDKVQ